MRITKLLAAGWNLIPACFCFKHNGGIFLKEWPKRKIQYARNAEKNSNAVQKLGWKHAGVFHFRVLFLLVKGQIVYALPVLRKKYPREGSKRS